VREGVYVCEREEIETKGMAPLVLWMVGKSMQKE